MARAEWEIAEGDSVIVTFLDGAEFSGVVRHQAKATGDCWIIDGKTHVHYVQTFASICKPLTQPGR